MDTDLSSLRRVWFNKASCNLLQILTQVQPYCKEICSNLGSVCGARLVEEDGQGVGRGVARRQGVGQQVAAQV